MQKLVFSSDELPTHLDDTSRFRLWHEIYTAQFGESEFQYSGDQPFRAHSEFAQVGEIGITRMDITLQKLVRSARHVAADARDDILIGFNRSARPQRVSQRGRDVVNPVGEVCGGIFTNAEPMEADINGNMAVVGLRIPIKQLQPRLSAVEDLVAIRLAVSPALIHLGRYLDFLLGSHEVHADPQLHGQVETTLLDLVVLSLGAGGAGGDGAELATGRGLRAARAREIIAMIQARYADPAFSPQEICRVLGISQRYLQELLQETGANLTERVLELRLQKACAMLADAANDRLKIADIAFASGFGDISYFNQAFRRRFGEAPTTYRGRQ
jgi:AraC-like DNA-binding protein